MRKINFGYLDNKIIPKNTFYCYKNDIYINYRHRCDDQLDCPFGEDEKNCKSKMMFKFKCHTDNRPISFLKVCDFIHDCLDGSDENLCGKIYIMKTSSH